jgi:hypothetical protein
MSVRLQQCLLHRQTAQRRSGHGGVRPSSRLLAMLGVGMLAAAAGSLPTTLGSAAQSTPSATLRSPMIATSPVTANPTHEDKASGRTQTSLDWAGYAVTGTTFTNVSGAWTQPAATCTVNKVEQAAFWVGMDGYSESDPTVQQVGTDSDCTKGKAKVKGGPSYYAWYQMYPTSVVVLSPSVYPVTPGDSISASVTLYGPDYVLHVADGTKWTFTTAQAPSTKPLDSSAEWIAEAPSSCSKSACKVLPLANFGSLGFSKASANGEAISDPAFTSYQINMTLKNPTKLKAQTSALTGAGSGFTVSWLHG